MYKNEQMALKVHCGKKGKPKHMESRKQNHNTWGDWGKSFCQEKGAIHKVQKKKNPAQKTNA